MCNELESVIGRFVFSSIQVIAIVVGLSLAGPAAAQVITSLSDETLPRSGRLIIYGTEFGLNQSNGRVMIGGKDAPISFWSGVKINAYVPEDAPLAINDVQVVTDTASSNTLPLNVTLRPPQQDRIKWRFTADDSYIMSQPAVGPDGTIYVTGVFGHLYAITPDGGILWVKSNVAGDRSPTVATDGTIYVTGAGGSVSALDPDGNVLWSWSGIGTVFVGPNVGPDGNIYGCTALSYGNETGAFVLSPDGQLLYSDAGSYNFRHSPRAWEVAFSGNQWFITSGMGFPLEGAFGLFAFDLGGGGPNWNSTGLGQAFGISNGGCCVNDPAGNRIACYAHDGTVDWSVSLNDLGGIPSPPSVGSDGTYYIPIQTPAHFHAVNNDGTIRWTRQFEWTRFPTVRPDNALVIAYESAGSFNPILMNGYSPMDGTVVWSVPLDVISGSRFIPQWYGEFSNDQDTFYIGSAGFFNFGEEFCYLYAIDASLPGLNADQFHVFRGTHAGGDISDTFDSDDSYLKFYPGITLNPMEPPVWIEFIGTASNSSPNVLSFIVESNVNTLGVQQTIELFDFSNNEYQTVDSRATTLSDSEVQVVLDDDASRFVEDRSNQVKARIGWKTNGPVFLFPWTVEIDHIQWNESN